ncbi:M48 family metallopeptidase, partial [Candidatus Uhrbacteria bacterium]|nr:M48 family metallopeptidase [Candidatus Uhrbacteria bacterium]
FVTVAIVYSLFSALVGYYTGDKVALFSSGARAVTAQEAPQLVRMVENLCITVGMPMPKIHVIDDSSINAFATGRDPEHASIAVTTGAMQKLENEELEGVLAHELSHVRNYDIRVMTVVIVLVGIVSIMADMIFRVSLRGGRRRDNDASGPLLLFGLALMIFAPLVAELIKLAVSRKREFLADASGALITRFPEGLARALEKIERDGGRLQRASAATAHLYIANPFRAGAFTALFSTHPPVKDRIEALRKMASLPS